MSLAAFIALEEQEQAIALRSYLKEKGADITEDVHEDGPLADLHCIIAASDVAFSEGTEQEIEAVFNNIIHLMLLLLEVPQETMEDLVDKFCLKLQSTSTDDKHSIIKLTLLNNLFNALPEKSCYRYRVYMGMLKLAGAADLMQHVQTDTAQVKEWLKQWETAQQKVNELWREMHDSLLASKHNDQAAQAMLELLSGYTDDNASQAREDAQKCIVTSMADPNTYLYDHLLALKPVKFLEGEPIHDLLTIFVSGKLSQYVDFHQKQAAFVTSLDLSHDQNMHKMRLLTFMQMAEYNEELSFAVIQSELQLGADEVEQFITDVIRSGTVRCRMDHVQRRVLVSSTTHRTFGKQQWQNLHDQLEQWQGNLAKVLNNIRNVAHAH